MTTLLSVSQLMLFGLSHQMVVTFKDENTDAFKHLFLEGYTGRAPQDVHTQEEVYSRVHFAVQQYLALPRISVGRYAYVSGVGVNGSALSLCQSCYSNGTIDPVNDTFHIDPRVVTGTSVSSYDVFLVSDEVTVVVMQSLSSYDMCGILLGTSTLLVWVGVIRYLSFFQKYNVCFYISSGSCVYQIVMDNSVHSGKVKIRLQNEASIHECRDPNLSGHAENYARGILDVLVASVCLLSLLLCGRSIFRGVLLQHAYVGFLRRRLGRAVSWSDRMEFINGWYILLIVSDMFTIIGSVIKIGIESKCVCVPVCLQFRTLSMVSECLFSLINGDDMFVTFAEMQRSGTLVWVFSQVYLYTFISLFIYMVSSLFIALITGAYDTITARTQEQARVTDLHAFIAACTDTPSSGKFRGPEGPSSCSFLCCDW
ncbi:mucolipin-1-like [Etheostoma cragini]|uniref:mucolipin-1-like n=1 Tax=Etheostoma cragini TaxID=417921 RepID=UPI00155E03D3|nr:mucolipin-1-like [Etheostoma cragini]